MKKLFYILLFLTSTIGIAQNVDIPDVVFKQALLLANSNEQQIAFDIQGNPIVVDVNQDGEIQISEALSVYSLDLAGSEFALFLVEGNPINDLTGLEAFSNLKHLDISTNQLAGQTFDATLFTNLESLTAKDASLSGIIVTNLVALKKLNVSGNFLSEINLNGLTNLEELIVFSNQIPSLDFSSTPSLKKLNAGANPLTTLNWSQLIQLTDLGLSFCQQITTVDVSGLVNLKTLDVSLTGITDLDVSNNILLTELNCSKDATAQSAIVNLDVSMLTNLQILQCASNDLTTLDVSGLQNLTYLSFTDNNVNNPIFGNNQNLNALDCGLNQIESLDLAQFPLLQSLGCSGNNLSALDFSSLQNLTYVSCGNNQFQSLDFSNNPNFRTLELGTNLQLEYLNLKNNSTEFFGIDFDSNVPNLIFICADENEISMIQSTLGVLNQNVVINSYCSFVPGGNYNTITGNVAFDLDQNGCDASDAVQPHVKVTINDGENQGSIFTDLQGNYTFYVQEGNYQLSIEIENSNLFTINGQNAIIEFLEVNNTTSNASFCIVPNGDQSDLEVVISPFSYPLPGQENFYQIYYRNKGNQILSGSINFTYNTEKASFILSVPSQNAINPDGSLQYQFSGLLPFESRSIIVQLNLNDANSANPVAIGDVLQFIATGTITGTDINPADNQFVYNQVIEEFMLLNSIICVEGEEVSADLIGDFLHYSVNFENNTDQTASFVVLRATINPEHFDVNSLQLLSSSSNVEVRITGNLLEIIFVDLELESGGHGNLLFKIRTTDQIQVNDSVLFETEVFFNEIYSTQTNTAITTFRAAISLDTNEFDAIDVSVYPNPTKSTITIQSDQNLTLVELYDVQGRLMQTHSLNKEQISIDLTNESNGIYFLKITSDKGSKVEKIMKE